MSYWQTLHNTPGVVNKVIMRSEALREVFAELDQTSDLLELRMASNAPHFRFTTFGNYGTNHVSTRQLAN